MATTISASRSLSMALGLIAHFSSPLLAQSLPPGAEIRKTNGPAVLFLRTTATLASGAKDAATGTGFLVTKNGYGITSAHVVPKSVPGASKVTYTAAVGGPQEVERVLTVIERDETNDLALIKIDPGPLGWPVVPVDPDADLDLDVSIYALGFPGGGSLDGVTGTVRSVYGSRYVTDAEIDHGSSGSPVFGSDGRLVAVALGAIENSNQRNLLVPIGLARPWLIQTGAIRIGGNLQPSLSAYLPTLKEPPPKELPATVLKNSANDMAFTRVPETMRLLGPAPGHATWEELNADLRTRGSLTLDGTQLVVGPPQSLHVYYLRVDTLELRGDARIITNGNTLKIEARRIVVHSGAVVAFPDERRAAPDGGLGADGVAGLDGGQLFLHVTGTIEGVLPIDLSGQDGGRGGQGFVGQQGEQGAPGEEPVTGLVACLRPGGNGHPGFNGGRGGPGGAGGSGGNGGYLQLYTIGYEDFDVRIRYVRERLAFAARGGRAGEAGPGGPGGRGGPGGSAGRGNSFCAAGNLGQPGLDGDVGPLGKPALAGKIGGELAPMGAVFGRLVDP